MAKSEGSQKGTEFASMLNQTLRLMKEHANEKLSGEGFEEKTDYGAKLQESTPGGCSEDGNLRERVLFTLRVTA